MVNRVVIGDWNGTGDYRIRGSRIGSDVLAALDPEQLAFDSAWKDGGVVYQTGTVSVFGGNSGNPPSPTTINFAETLPSIPFVLTWRKLNETQSQMGAASADDNTYRIWGCMATTTGLTFFGPPGKNEEGTFTVAYVVIRSLTDG